MIAFERRLAEALQFMIEAAEEFASSDPEMPSHKETEQTFEKALDGAKDALNKWRKWSIE